MKTLTLNPTEITDACKICPKQDSPSRCSKCPTFTVMTTSDYRKMRAVVRGAADAKEYDFAVDEKLKNLAQALDKMRGKK